MQFLAPICLLVSTAVVLSLPAQDYDRTMMMTDERPSMERIIDEEEQAVEFHKLHQTQYRRLKQEENRKQEIQRARLEDDSRKEAAALAAVTKKNTMVIRTVANRSYDTTSLTMDRDEETQAQERAAREKVKMEQMVELNKMANQLKETRSERYAVMEKQSNSTLEALLRKAAEAARLKALAEEARRRELAALQAALEAERLRRQGLVMAPDAENAGDSFGHVKDVDTIKDKYGVEEGHIFIDHNNPDPDVKSPTKSTKCPFFSSGQ